MCIIQLKKFLWLILSRKILLFLFFLQGSSYPIEKYYRKIIDSSSTFFVSGTVLSSLYIFYVKHSDKLWHKINVKEYYL